MASSTSPNNNTTTTTNADPDERFIPYRKSSKAKKQYVAQKPDRDPRISLDKVKKTEKPKKSSVRKLIDRMARNPTPYEAAVRENRKQRQLEEEMKKAMNRPKVRESAEKKKESEGEPPLTRAELRYQAERFLRR